MAVLSEHYQHSTLPCLPEALAIFVVSVEIIGSSESLETAKEKIEFFILRFNFPLITVKMLHPLTTPSDRSSNYGLLQMMIDIHVCASLIAASERSNRDGLPVVNLAE